VRSATGSSAVVELVPAMSVRVDGAPATFEDAVDRAAAVFSAGRTPVVAGLGTDVAGVRAAMRLAERVGAAVGHKAGASLSRQIALLAENGLMFATPAEAGRRADLVLLVGDLARRADWLAAVFAQATERPGGVALGACDAAVAGVGGRPVATIAAGPASQRAVLLALKARVAGRPVDEGRLGRAAVRDLDRAAKALAAARYGVVVWDAGDLDALAVEAAAGLVKDLNAATRFVALPFPGEDNAAGAVQVSAWTTGFGLPLGFPGGVATYDPWRFDVERLVASGEADAALWISALSAAVPPWNTAPPTVALVAPGTRFAAPPAVVIEVRAPERTADAVLHDSVAGVLAAVPAPRRKAAADALPTVAEVVDAILARLAGKPGPGGSSATGGAPC
jgi:formylmethanofuran dehydrogenase subunit B